MKKFLYDLENLKIDLKSLALMNKKNDDTSQKEESECLIRDFSAINHSCHANKEEKYLNIILRTISKTKRSIVDIQIIKVCLSQIPNMKLLLVDESSLSIQELFFRMANVIKHEKSKENNFIIKTGHNIDKFFIILKGSVTVLKPKEVKVNISIEEYKQYLMKLYDLKEFLLFDHLTKKNKNVFGDGLQKELDIYKVVSSKKNFNGLSNHINKMCKEQYLKQINIPFDKIGEIENDSTKPLRNYKCVSVYHYYIDKNLNPGDMFGDLFLNLNLGIGQGTIITNVETEFAVIDKNSFDEITTDITEKFKRNVMKFMNSCYLFKKIDLLKLQQYFFYFYLNKTVSRTSIVQEGDDVKEIFFINSGVYEVSKRMSLIELIKMISEYTQNEEDKNYMDMIEYELRSSSREYDKLMKEKKKIVFFTYTNGDIFGLEDFCCENKHEFTLEHSKMEGEIYKIEVNVN